MKRPVTYVPDGQSRVWRVCRNLAVAFPVVAAMVALAAMAAGDGDGDGAAAILVLCPSLLLLAVGLAFRR